MSKINKKIILFHHLDLGDNIMCHGIIREYCKTYEKVIIFSYPHNYPSISFMYRDLDNLEIIKADKQSARDFVKKSTKTEFDVKKIGFENLAWTSNIPLEKQFYQLANVNLSKKWGNFFIKRDKKREGFLFKKEVKSKKYIFLHEDEKRKFLIKRNLINNKKYQIIEPNKNSTSNVFDYMTIIENAEEIHVIDSCFMFLIDCMKYKNPNQKLFIHRYARENEIWKLPILKKDWIIINKQGTFIDYVESFMTSLYKSKIIFSNNNLFERILRKINKIVGIQFNQQTKSKPTDFIKRYSIDKTFFNANSDLMNGLKINLLAKKYGAKKESSGEKVKYDIVFYSEKLRTLEKIGQLSNICKDKLILNVKCMPNIPFIKKISFGKKILIPTEKYIKEIIKKNKFYILETTNTQLTKTFICKKYD